MKSSKADSDRKTYTSPRVETVTVSELMEAVGPAQGLASGTEAASLAPSKSLVRSGAPHRNRAPR